MTLKERCADLIQDVPVRLSASALYRYYRQAKITYRMVDLHTTIKLKRAHEIRCNQLAFVKKITEAKQQKIIFWLDETSVSLWSPLKRRTWTNGQITLPYQAKRGHNMTVIGAVGGRSETLYWVSSVVRRTCKEFVRQFIEKLVTRVPV